MADTPASTPTPKAAKKPQKQKRLGRGLSSLLSTEAPVSVPPPAHTTPPAAAVPPTAPAQVSEPATAPDATPKPSQSSSELQYIALSSIVPNKFQPRTRFDDAELEALATSIAHSGVMQPIVVRPSDAGFELIAGERRWRAAQRAKLSEIPAVVRDLEDRDAAEWALVENTQRSDLSPVEKAKACAALQQNFGLNQSEIGERVGLDRASVSNLIRLLDLDGDILELIDEGKLGLGHGKALLGIQNAEQRMTLARRAAEEELSVRETERLSKLPAAAPTDAPNNTSTQAPSRVPPELADLERQLTDHLGTKVKVKARAGGHKGKIEIPFASLDHFDGIMSVIGFTLKDE